MCALSCVISAGRVPASQPFGYWGWFGATSTFHMGTQSYHRPSHACVFVHHAAPSGKLMVRSNHPSCSCSWDDTSMNWPSPALCLPSPSSTFRAPPGRAASSAATGQLPAGLTVVELVGRLYLPNRTEPFCFF